MIYSIYLNIIFKVFILNLYTLIGPIGAGKTEVQRILEERDIKCVCADNIVKELYKKKYVIDELNNIFPNMFKNGKLEKSKIRDIIFSDVKKMREIENYMHPKVILEFENIKEIYKDNKIVFFIIPIIKDNIFLKKNKIVYIDSKESIRIERLKKRKDYNESIINKIIKYQNTIDIYKKDCTYYIENNGTISNLKLSVYELMKKI